MHTFTEIPSQSIRHLPEFYHEDNRYFAINREGVPIGYISIRPFSDGCNFGVHLFDSYRINNNIVIYAFKLPDKLGYSRIYFGSNNKIVTNFLDYMGKFGILYVCNMFGKKYYAKDGKV
jgi:hypothetical protein